MHKDALDTGAKVVVVDDLLATGGTAYAATQLALAAGAKVTRLLFVIDLHNLGFLDSRKRLAAYDCVSLAQAEG